MPTEADIIKSLTHVGPPFAGVGIGDDAAMLPDGTLLTTDTMIEGVHWDHRLSPADVGFKLVAVNVSDIAAMGGVPRWALLNLAVPAPDAWLDGFRLGLAEALDRVGVSLIGGDTVRSPLRALTLTLGGSVSSGGPILRSTGMPGDDLYVSGSLGLAAEGFLSPAPRPQALARLRRPVPRLALGQALVGVASAMMDLSDGLAQDLPRLCAASGVGALVIPDDLPGDGTLEYLCAFGEDYELLFSAPAVDRFAVEHVASLTQTPVTRIGVLTPAPEVRLQGCSWPVPLFNHFPPEHPVIAR